MISMTFKWFWNIFIFIKETDWFTIYDDIIGLQNKLEALIYLFQNRHCIKHVLNKAASDNYVIEYYTSYRTNITTSKLLVMT